MDSLWYERLAETTAKALEYGHASPAVLGPAIQEFYEKSLSLPNPSWLSHKGLGEAKFREQKITDAIASVNRALECAEAPDSSPLIKPEDIVKLNLQLGDYYYEARILDKAADHYGIACVHGVGFLNLRAQIGYLKVKLCSSDTGASRQLLWQTLRHNGSEARFVTILKELARDKDHDAVIVKMFTVAKCDELLFNTIVHALETASALSEDARQPRTSSDSDDRFAEDETRGVLLYDRALAASVYNTAIVGADINSKAVKLWRECGQQLIHVGGPRACATRDAATTALSKYFFQSMIEGNHLDFLTDLKELCESQSYFTTSKPIGFLGTLHSRYGDDDRAKQTLSRDVKIGLQILSDYNEDNDVYGFDIIENALLRVGDLQNAAMALSLRGMPDVVSEGLTFENDPNKQLGQKISQVVKSQVPDTKKQLERIQAAKAHVEALLESPDIAPNNEVTRTVYKDVLAKINLLQSVNTPKEGDFQLQGGWWCDGTREDGRNCNRVWDLQNDLYQCLYCADTVFCEPCLARLRNPGADYGTDIFACSQKHKWLKVPRLGADMYVGPKGKVIQIPTRVMPLNQGDDQILEIRYENDSEISLDIWKEKLAETWGFSLVDISEEVRRVTSPTAGNAEGNLEAIAEGNTDMKNGLAPEKGLS